MSEPTSEAMTEAPAGSPEAGEIEVISFEIAGQEFCIDIRAVREIRGWTPATPLPNAPNSVLGVINLRGVIMPVIDLRSRLGLGATEPTPRHVIVVIHHAQRTFGLLVDGVQESFRFEASRLQPPPELGDDGGTPVIDAILPWEGRLITRLIVSALMPAGPQTAAA
jgi:purine-binding chemotaxis protein CheW